MSATGTDIFTWHGYTEVYVDGAWRKATPTFNATLCAKVGVQPLDFDGHGDALLHPFDGAGRTYMQYVRDHGAYFDVPEHVRGLFAGATRVTTYGRAATLARRRPAELELLRAAGLTRVHVGMESGSDAVLARVEKGCTAAELVTAGRQVLEAGIELCYYVMPGLGGRDLAAEHVRGTAAVLREVAAAAAPADPLVVRLRTAAVVPGTPLADDEEAGRFVLPDDVEVAAELRELLGLLDGVPFELRSDHALNLMSNLEGSLPADRDRLLGLLDEFLALPAARQAELAWTARTGMSRRVGASRDLRGAPVTADDDGKRDAETDEMLETAKRLRARFL